MVDTTQSVVKSVDSVSNENFTFIIDIVQSPFIISIFSFALGIISTIWISNRKEKKELENIKKMFFEYEREFLKSVNKQLGFFKEYINIVDSYQAFDLKPFRRVVFNFDFYQSFDKGQLYKSLEDYKSNSETSISYEFNKLHNFFEQNFMKLYSFHEEIVEKINEDRKRWNDDVKVIHEFQNSLNELHEIFSKAEIEQLRTYYTNFFKPLKDDKKSATEIYNEYVRPLIDSLQKKLAYMKGNQEIGAIILRLQQLSFYVNSFSENKKFLKEAIGNFIEKSESVLPKYNLERRED